MPYDPNFPPDHQDLNAAPFRNQFAGLKALIDAVPASSAMNDVLTANTAALLTGVPPVNFTVSDPPTHDEVQAIADMVNALYVAMTRT
jgi:hypothetical protein